MLENVRAPLDLDVTHAAGRRLHAGVWRMIDALVLLHVARRALAALVRAGAGGRVEAHGSAAVPDGDPGLGLPARVGAWLAGDDCGREEARSENARRAQNFSSRNVMPRCAQMGRIFFARPGGPQK